MARSKESIQKESDISDTHKKHNFAMTEAAIKNGIRRILSLQADKQAISNEIGELKNGLKKDHDISIAAINHELRLQKMSAAERATFQTDAEIIRDVLGAFTDTPDAVH